MSNFERDLPRMLDMVADSVRPHTSANPVFVSSTTVPTTTSTGGGRGGGGRPRWIAAAAAAVIVVGGGTLAFAQVGSGPEFVRSASQSSSSTSTAVGVTTTSSSTTTTEKVTAATLPKAVESGPAVTVAFTVNLGFDGRASDPMKHGFFGTANPGATVKLTSPYGTAQVVADAKGFWEKVLKMEAVPVGAVVVVKIGVSAGSSQVFEFALERLAPPPPVTEPKTTEPANTEPKTTEPKTTEKPAPAEVEFTANLGSDGRALQPMKHGFYGTATPGSVIHLSSEFGSAEVVAGSKGKWEAKLVMYEVPIGTIVHVRITASSSPQAFEFDLERLAPAVVERDFTANAAFESCDSDPPYNEYWGTSTSGAVITISSPYGSKQVTANAEGKWEARVEFPSAPFGETFNVQLTSSKGSAVYNFSLVRLEPV
jgi:hypothetical protein